MARIHPLINSVGSGEDPCRAFFDPEGRVVYANEHFRNVIPLDNDSRIDAHGVSDVPASDRARMIAAVEEYLACKGDRMELDFMTGHTDGPRAFRWKIIMLADKNERPLVLIMEGFDLTTRVSDRIRDLLTSEMADHLTDAFIITDPDQHVILWNKIAGELFGIPASEALGRKFPDMISLQPGPEIDRLQGILSSKNDWSGDLHLKKPDGHDLHLHGDHSIIRDDNSGPIGHLAIFRDITGSMLAQEERSLQELVLTNILDGVLTTTADDRIINYNAMAEQIFGAPLSEVVGERADQVVKFIEHPTRTDVEDSIRRIGFWQGNAKILRRDGTTLAIEIRTQIINDHAGKFKCKLTFLRDITRKLKIEEERNESIQRFEAVSQATDDMIWEWDIIHDMVICQGDNKRLWVGETRKGITMCEFLDFLYKEDRTMVESSLRKSVKNRKKDRWQAEYRMKGLHGEEVHVLDRAVILRDTEGNAFRMIGAIQDITERVDLEKRLIKQQEEEHRKTTRMIFETQEAERSRLATDLHDNVNPLLAAARLHINAAESTPEDPGPYLLQSKSLIHEGIEEIRKISHNLSNTLINEFLLEDLVMSTLRKLNPDETLKVHTEFRKLDTLSPATSMKLNVIRIIQEQVHNTLKYAHASNLYIKLHHRDNVLSLTKRDDGKGFDPKALRTGIGLANIRNRVESYHGSMKLSSSPGKGCKLEIEFPVHDQLP